MISSAVISPFLDGSKLEYLSSICSAVSDSGLVKQRVCAGGSSARDQLAHGEKRRRRA